MKYIVRSVDGREYGPFGSDELRELADQSRLGPGDFVRRETGRTWSPFERIPGLGDRPPTPRTDAPSPGPGLPSGAENAPELEITEFESTPEPLEEAEDAEPDDLVSTVFERTSGSGHELDLARASANANALVENGVLVVRLPGESDVFTLNQSFLDMTRNSLLAAVLGRRGALICTNRRIATVLPDLMTQSTRIAYPERIRSIGVERRTSPLRLVFGAILLLNAILTVVGAGLLGTVTTALDAAAGTSIAAASTGASVAIAAIFGLAGVLLLLTSTSRALVVDGGESISFPCGRVTAWHLGRLDEARNAAIADLDSRRTDDVPGSTG